MKDKDWLEIIVYFFFSVLVLAALFLKVSWLEAVCFIVAGIIGILAAIFKWDDVLFYNHFWIDLDINIWYRILNGVIGLMFIVGGVLIHVLKIKFW